MTVCWVDWKCELWDTVTTDISRLALKVPAGLNSHWLSILPGFQFFICSKERWANHLTWVTLVQFFHCTKIYLIHVFWVWVFFNYMRLLFTINFSDTNVDFVWVHNWPYQTKYQYSWETKTKIKWVKDRQTDRQTDWQIKEDIIVIWNFFFSYSLRWLESLFPWSTPQSQVYKFWCGKSNKWHGSEHSPTHTVPTHTVYYTQHHSNLLLLVS